MPALPRTIWIVSIETLNLIVSAYLDFAELQARSHKTMAMRDWITKLDDFLRLSDRELLTHASIGFSAIEERPETWP
jgi:hypothetical protein